MATPTTWSERLVAYAGKQKLLQADIADEFDIWASVVLGWFRGAKPRDKKMLERVEKWSKGAVPADAPARASEPLHWRRKRLAASA